jgi:hypothetical protein
MKPSPKALTVALTAALLSAGAAAQQTLTFDNTSPAITVQLQNGQNMTIQTNGNVTARCVTQASGTGTTCVGLPTGGGGGGNPPTASIAASNFSQAPDVNNQYPAGTSFTITPTVANAEVCLRQTAPSNTGWTGAITSFGAGQFSLPTASTSYGFTLKCFGEGGFVVSNTISLATNAGGGGGGGDQCPSPPPGATPPSGYTLQTPPTRFSDLPTLAGGNCSDFPNTGATLCRVSMLNNRYMSMKFTMPTGVTSGNIIWEELQSGAAPADLHKIYFSITQCPGDFRIPTSATGTVSDPTHAWFCRNYHALPGSGIGPFRTGISFNGTGQAGNFACGLTAGNTYYFNFVMADPSDGTIGPSEGGAACTAANGVCGVQLQVNSVGS